MGLYHEISKSFFYDIKSQCFCKHFKLSKHLIRAIPPLQELLHRWVGPELDLDQDVARQTIIQVIRRWLNVIRLQVPFKSGGTLSDFVKCAAWKKCIFLVLCPRREAESGGGGYTVHMWKGGDKRDGCRWQTFWLESLHTTTPWGHKGQGGYIPTHVLYSVHCSTAHLRISGTAIVK